ncbi:hypothetical protein CANARDRAFT_202000 [[Candida] arabinofermentans NRRL YB-2248]|uniref:Transcription factor spt8 beta-propeller domain-containing protein n=1 Tax=[Candida] arabinofermentans NRRL YB-2248 TaxID=983967 RepID=A0A1E4SX71_9ASCO|nr:hypothetical protein CANARDRAFT_202000 [[Candida] arabinofermentans NRRL YB-2248]
MNNQDYNEDEEDDDEDDDDDEDEDDDEDDEDDEEEDDEDDEDDEEEDDDADVDAEEPNARTSDISKQKSKIESTNKENESATQEGSKPETKQQEKPEIEVEQELSIRQKLLQSAHTKNIHEVLPIVAIPYSTPVHSITLTKGPKWLFTGGEDGLIRKFDLFGSVEGNSPLTVAQRHQLVDSISYGGVICSYWENEQPYYKEDLLAELANDQIKNSKGKKNQKVDINNITVFEAKVSPVYSMSVESEGRWLLSGLRSGGISLQSVRINEGAIQYYFKQSTLKGIPESEKAWRHSDTVSCLKLNGDEDKFLSGGWDMKIIEWDLNTGKAINKHVGSTGQISSLEYRPTGGVELKFTDDNNNKEDEDLDSLFGESSDNEGDDDDNDDEQKYKEADKESNDIKDTAKKDFAEHQKKTTSSGIYETQQRSATTFLSSSINGTANIWDTRISPNAAVNNVSTTGGGSTPWCMSATWGNSGNTVFVGRRNAIVEEYDVRYTGSKSLSATTSASTSHTTLNGGVRHLKFPIASGPISCVRTLPNDNYLLCGCQDNIRLWDLRMSGGANDWATNELVDDGKNKNRKIPFMIIPGHNGGILSDLYIDPTCRFMVSASGNRGWQGKAGDYVFIYEIFGN